MKGLFVILSLFAASNAFPAFIDPSAFMALGDINFDPSNFLDQLSEQLQKQLEEANSAESEEVAVPSRRLRSLTLKSRFRIPMNQSLFHIRRLQFPTLKSLCPTPVNLSLQLCQQPEKRSQSLTPKSLFHTLKLQFRIPMSRLPSHMKT